MIGNNTWMRVLIVSLFLFIFSTIAQARSAAEGKQITVVFRFDDYSSHSSTDLGVKVIDTFQKYHVPCTFGVIPYIYAGKSQDTSPQDVIPLTPMKADILKKAIESGILEVALHGYSHQTIRAWGGYTEFSGLDYNSQVERIAKGKNLLEEMLNTRVTTFIPPWDRYDLNTIRALERLGFGCISAGGHGNAKESSPLQFLPATCGLSRLRDAIASARRNPEVQPIIVVRFHGYGFLETGRGRGRLTYQEFVELLGWLTSQKDIHVGSINQTTKVIGDLSARRFINYNSYFKLSSLIPPFLSSLSPVPVGVYLSLNTPYYNMKNRLWAFVSLFYLATLLIAIAIAFFGGFILFPRSGLVASISKYGGPALLVLLSIYALHDLVLSYRGAMVLTVLLGGCLGVWSSFIKLRKQGRLK